MAEIRPGDKHSPPGDYVCWAPMAGIQFKINYLRNKLNKKLGRGKK